MRYGEIIEAARARTELYARRQARDRFTRAAIFALFPYPRRLRAARLLLEGAEATGLRRALHKFLETARLPAALAPLAAMERLAPPVASPERLARRLPAQGRRRGVVGLLAGCVQSVFFSQVNAATARVLSAEGLDVVVAEGQGCCGALSLHAGRQAEAARLAKRTVAAFERAGVELVVANAAGCGSAMKDYGRLLAGDASYKGASAWLAGHTRDLSELLASVEPRAERHPLPVVAAFHDACHLAHAQGIRSEPRQLLAQIPGLELREVGDDTCCGSAGVYNILQPGPARALGARKAAALAATGADVVVSTNPGCLMQIQASAPGSGRPLRTLHLAEILDLSIRGDPLPPSPKG